MKRHGTDAFRRIRIAMALVATLLICGAVPTFANDVIGTAVIGGGPLTMVAVNGPTFATVLDGTDQTASATITVVTTDRRGTGEGWNLQITSTQFAAIGDASRTLPETATLVTSVTSVCLTIPCSDVANSVNYPLTVPAGQTAPTPERFFTAGPGTGMGEYSVNPTFELLIPSNAYAGTYTSVITITIASGS